MRPVGGHGGQSGRLAARDRARGAQRGGRRTADSDADMQPGRRDGDWRGGVGRFWDLLTVPRTGDRLWAQFADGKTEAQGDG